MPREHLEYFIAEIGHRRELIGMSDMSPGMLEKLRNHDIPSYEASRIEIRGRVTGKLIQVIDPAKSTGWPD
jgi:hypothetical protein